MTGVFRIVIVASLLAAAPWTASAEETRPELRLGERLERLESGDPGGRYRLKMDVEAVRAAARLQVELPEGRTAAVRRRSVERRARVDFLWTGESSRGDRIVLTGEGGRVAGTIFGVDRTYRIFPSQDGGHEILEAEAGAELECGGVAESAGHEGGRFEGERPAVARSDSQRDTRRAPLIDLLVAYDSASTAAVGGKRNIRTIVQHYVDLTNVAFHNSEIEARVRLVDSVEVTLPANVLGNNFAVLGWLQESSEIASLRASSGADMVGVLSENTSRACGVAAMIYRPGGPGAGQAFFESRRRCGAETFAHEIGHLMGADHDPANASVARGQFIYGRGHLYDGRYRTIMSYTTECGSACPAQPFFSNPAISHDGRTTGHRQRDNARLMSELATDIERFVGAINNAGECPLTPGDSDYCLVCGPCVAGEGNCVEDVDCASGLSCAQGAGPEFGFDRGVGVCTNRGVCELEPGDPDYCIECGPCAYGDGDCDSNRECQTGLTCLDDQGEIFGQAPWVDVCGFREDAYCPLEPGHPDYCSACGPCAAGEGNCRANGECRGVLRCFEGVGSELGFKLGVGVCLAGAPADCPFSPGHPNYCKLCGVCDEGVGDCDTDRECKAGLSCVDGSGAALGFDEAVDVCLEGSGGTALKAPKKLRARVVSGHRVRLRWKDKSDGESGFHVELSRDGGTFERLESVGANKKKRILSDLDSGTYTFRVQAFNDGRTSAYSNERTVKLP